MTAKPLALVALLLLAACEQPADHEASLFISPQQYEPYGIDARDDEASYVKLTKTWYPDLSTKVEYEYHPPEPTPGIQYLTQEITTSLTPVETTVGNNVTGLLRNAIFEANGLKVQETNEYHNNAATRTFQIVNKEGLVVGNIVQSSWDRVAYNAIIIGAYITGPDLWKAIFDEKFAAIAAHDWPLFPDFGQQTASPSVRQAPRSLSD